MTFTPGKVDCKPTEVGYDESRIAVLHKHFEKLLESGKIVNASYCVSRYGKVFMHGAMGPFSYKKGEKRAMKPSDIQYVASITKLFAATAFLKLVEDGITRLDIPVKETLPQFDALHFRDITAYDLLTHTSGMYPDGGCFDDKYHKGYWSHIGHYIKSYKAKDGEFDWLTAGLSVRSRKRIGEEWQYCSFGITVIGEMIRKLTGKRAEDYITEEILRPLGMKDTCFESELNAKNAKNHIIQHKWSEKYLKDIIAGKKPDRDDELWNQMPSTSSGIVSNARDMNRFGTMLLHMGTTPDGVRIIGRKIMEKATSHALFNVPNFCWGAQDKNRGFGIGFDMRHGPAFTFSDGTFNHEGAGASALYMDPKEQLTAFFFVPFKAEGWHSEALFNTINIIWSGLK